MTIIAIMFFISFMVGMPLAFIDDFCFEDFKGLEAFSGPFAIPEDMVFFTEWENLDFWPSTEEHSAIQLPSLHHAMVKFWQSIELQVVVAPERRHFPQSIMNTPELSYSL